MSAIGDLDTIISLRKKNTMGALPERENVLPIHPRIGAVKISSPHKKLSHFNHSFCSRTFHIDISSPRIAYATLYNPTVFLLHLIEISR